MNRFFLHRSFRQRAVTVAGLATLLLALIPTAGAEPGNDSRAPELTGDCEQINVGAGQKIVAHAYAVGVQIYRSNGTGWSFVGPEAVLFHGDEANDAFGIHYGGPTWESASGSKAVGALVDRCFPDPTAVPWLLLKATASEGPGIFDGVTFI